MRALVFEQPGRLRWDDLPDPVVSGPDQAVVRPVAAATCDLDTAVLRGQAPLPGPYPFGHEAVAEVAAVGEAVTSVAIGDLVVVPFQISCGACARCRAGRTGNCETHRPMSSYGLLPIGGDWGGLVADLALVPHADAMLVRLPEGVSPAAVASASDNLPDGYRTVAGPLREAPGAPVLVVGGGAPSIGLYAVGYAVALGSSRVVYIDADERRRRVAGGLGAEVMEAIPTRRVGRFPITVDASARPEGLAAALRSTDYDGTCTSTGIYYADPPMPLLDAYTTGITFVTGRPHARALIPAALEVVASGAFDPLPVTDAVVDWEDAAEALAHPADKTVLVREGG